MFIRVLGPVELTGPEGVEVEISAEKRRRLLAALVLRANTWVSSDYLVGAVWPDRPPKSTDGNVKTYIHYLRGLVAPPGEEPRIDSRRGAYRLRIERDECDATVFEDLVVAVTEDVARARPTVAVEQLRTALGLWRGHPYEPLSGHEAAAEAERLRALLWHARYVLAEALSATGRADEAITLLWPLTTEDPLREKTWEHLMRALSSDGRWAEVLIAFEKARQVLSAELGVLPGPELRRLHELALHVDEPRRDQLTPVRRVNENAGDAAVPDDVVAEGPRRNKRTRRAVLLSAIASVVVVLVGLTSANRPSVTTYTGTPVLTFLSPSPGQVVTGVVALRVRASNPSRLRQVDFHQLTSRCPGGGYKRYIGPDETPTADGVYEISFDTRQAPYGCLDFGAVGLDRADAEILYPHEGTYVPVTVDNG